MDVAVTLFFWLGPRLYEGFFLLADRGDLLDRFRRALRRRTRRAASGSDDASPVPDADPPQDGEPQEDGEPTDDGEPLAAVSSED